MYVLCRTKDKEYGEMSREELDDLEDDVDDEDEKAFEMYRSVKKDQLLDVFSIG